MWKHQYTYLPEGMYSGSQNNEYFSNFSALERAMAQGKILEAPAILCDGDLSLIVDLGIMQGVIPRGQAALSLAGEPIKDIAIISRVGKPVCFQITGFEGDGKGGMRAILSRRAAQAACLHDYLMCLQAGDIIPARVTHLEHFGAFVDVGCGLASLFSIDSISISRISHPRDRFYVGMPVRAVVKSVDASEHRIYVSHKELLGTWEENAAKFCVGQTVVGTVRSVEDYGVFIELAPNLAGLAEYRDDVVVGQAVAVYIKNIISERMKIKLVIIDTCKSSVSHSAERMEYFIPPEVDHIDYWRYSPEGNHRIIESVFGPVPLVSNS
ncbi:MAG: 30S ribosomal protein S1 [Clostridia bacterium]|nr:30S ribosomal protein S1 [Clostridia bacterium]